MAEFQRTILPKRLGQMVILILFTLCLCLQGGRAGTDLEKSHTGADEKEQWNSVSEELAKKKPRKAPAEEKGSFGALYGLEEYDVPKKELDFAELKRQDNPHIYAWITIPDTKIDYPVLQHPDQADYYLNHNIDQSVGYPSCIYTQYYNSMDWTDNNTVIYGHNMRDGSMFADLQNYSGKSFFEDNPYIYIYTEDSVLVYHVFAAYPFSDAHLLIDYDTGTKSGYEDYLQMVRRTAAQEGIYDEDAAPDGSEPVITLSTCVSGQPRQRFLVQAALEAKGKLLR